MQAAINSHEQEHRMTKARTVGGKRRGRPRKEGPRQPNGEPSRIAPERREEAQRQVAIARCRLMGWEITLDNLKYALSEHLGCKAGRAIDPYYEFWPEEGARLWKAIDRIRRVFTGYWIAMSVPPPYAKSAMLTYLPDKIGSDGVEASTWDNRSEEERVRAAVTAMMHMERVLGMVGYGVASEVKQVVLHDAKVRDYAKLVAGLRSAME